MPSSCPEIAEHEQGQHRLKTSPISHYQGEMACESMVRLIKHREKHHGQGACAAAHNSIGSCVGGRLSVSHREDYCRGKANSRGQRQLEQGQSALEAGKAKLEAGKAKLEAGKRVGRGSRRYEQAKDNPFLVLADKCCKAERASRRGASRSPKETSRLPKETSRLPRRGPGYRWGRRLDAGELELRRGREQLRLAKGARVACAVGAAFFASLSIVLGFCWRRSLAWIFMHTDASQGTSP